MVGLEEIIDLDNILILREPGGISGLIEKPADTVFKFRCSFFVEDKNIVFSRFPAYNPGGIILFDRDNPTVFCVVSLIENTESATAGSCSDHILA